MTVVALQSSFLIVILVLLNVQCIPHNAIWDVTIQSTAKCKIIYDLNLTIQKKLGLAVVFSLGALAIVCSVFRLYDTLKLATELDILYYTGPVLLWCTAEITCGFFVACAPILPRVVKEIPGLRNMFGGRSTRQPSSAGFGRNLQTIGGGGTGPHRVRKTDPYSQIDDDGIPLDELKASESTEHLGKAAQLGRSDGIICTTQIEVTHDDDSSNGVADRGSRSPWEQVEAVPGSIRP
ncbi:hypothetical protein SLS53_005214 [Cytospora paraplurivora]|uniref:Rhodopsin domain-containing protein n=1 Tax=Cytospora paraplurivora TaxID=2898453 RepID=A0AAN9U666_9PEZI